MCLHYSRRPMATIQPLIKAIAYKRSAFMWMAAVCIALSRWRRPCVMRSVGLTAHEWRAGVVSLLLQQSRKGPRQSYSPRRKRCPVRCGWRLWKPTAIASACWHSMRLTACLNGSQLMMCLHNFWNSHHFRVMMLNEIASFFVSWSWVTLLVCLLHSWSYAECIHHTTREFFLKNWILRVTSFSDKPLYSSWN